MKKGFIGTLVLSVILSTHAIADEMSVQASQDVMAMLVNELNDSVAEGDKTAVGQLLEKITAVAYAEPPWVAEALELASGLSAAQEEDYLLWQELQAEMFELIELGELAAAAEVAEGGFLLAQESFGERHWSTIQSSRDVGALALGLGDAETADAFLNEALALSMEVLGEAHPETQNILSSLARLYHAMGAMDGSMALQELIIANYEEAFGAGHALTLEALFLPVEAYEVSGDYLGAAEMLQGVCGLFAESLSVYHPKTSECDVSLAYNLREAGRFAEADATLQSIVANIAASSDVINEVAVGVLMNLADLRSLRGDNQGAKEMLSGLIMTARQIGAIEESYNGKNYLARALTSQGQLDEAEMLLQDLVTYGATAWSQQDPISYYNSLLELGDNYQRQSRLADAEAIFEESLAALLELAGDQHPSTLVAMNNLGNIYEQLGLYDEAEPILKQTLAGMETVFGLANLQTTSTRNNLALLHESQGNFREAEPLYLSSYEYLVGEFGDDHAATLAVQNNLAYLYMMMGEYEGATAMFEDLVERWSLLLGPDHQDALKARNNLGRAFQKQGMLAEAEQQVSNALLARRQNLGENHIDTIRSRIDLGAIYLDQGRLDLAVEELQSALTLAESVIGEQHPYTFEALNNLARALELQGQVSDAVRLREMGLARRSQFLDRMLWVTGENAREGYIRLHEPELHDYLALLTRSGDPEAGKKALEASLQRKGLLLKITSEIEQIAQLSNDPLLSDTADALEAARKELAALTLSGPTAETQGRHAEALYELELRVNELQGELGRASVRYRSSIAGVSVDEVAESLGSGAALVDFLMYEDGGENKVLAAVMVNTESSTRYELVEFSDRAEIESAVLDYREIIQDDLADEDELFELGQIAHEVIWTPITGSIEGMEYVYLVPDGVLNILPFNALINEEEQYLIETTDLHILTSGRDLLPNEFDLASGDYVILAGPDYDADQIVAAGELAAAEGRRSAAMQLGIRGAGSGLRGLNFAPLPGAEEEGRIITDRVRANDGDSDVYFGEAAQENVLANIEETPEILHMATHGFFLEADDNLRKRLLKMQRSSEVQVPPPGDNPLLRSGLAFAGINRNASLLGDIDTDNDGVLTALEVLGLDLSGTRLVVLSACETGLGEIHEGEGVYGLRRSFQEAGVAEVISSLWEVSDAGTQALMTDLYERILQGTPAREALREVQIAMIDSPEWGYPYVWSAFMIVGSYESAGMTIQ